MGANLSSLEKFTRRKKASKLFELSLEQVKEYFAVFKASCNSFWIDFSEFALIFGERKEIFDIWDGDQSDLIDALEVFAGITVLCQTKLEEKVRMVCSIFDFNDFRTFSLPDIEYMIKCCFASVMKVCSGPEPLKHTEIQILMTQAFRDDVRVNVFQLIQFFKAHKEFSDFFKAVGHEPPSAEQGQHQDRARPAKSPEGAIPRYLLEKATAKDGESLLKKFEHAYGHEITFGRETRKRNQFLERSLRQFDPEVKGRRKVKDARLSLKWVYGFRCNDSIKSVFYYNGPNSSSRPKLEQRLVYFVSNTVVVYYFRTNQQRHYLEHKNEVSAMAVSARGEICATAEKGKHSVINIWDADTLKTLFTFSSDYPNEVYLMSFVSNDDYLACVYKQAASPIVVFKLASGQAVASGTSASFIMGLAGLVSLSGDVPSEPKESPDNSFCCYSRKEVFLYQHDCDLGDVRKASVFAIAEGCPEEISQCCGAYLSPLRPEASFYVDQKHVRVTFYIAVTSGMLHSAVMEPGSDLWSAAPVYNFKRRVVQMIMFRSKHLCLATENGVVHLFNIAERQVWRQVELARLAVRLESTDIKNLVAGHKNSVFVSTWDGDLVKISLKPQLKWRQSLANPTTKCKSFQSVAHLLGPLSSMCFVRPFQASEHRIYVGGENGTIYCFSSDTRQLLHQWKTRQPVTALASMPGSEDSVVIVAGLSNGMLVFFVDNVETWTDSTSNSAITILRFSGNGRYLFAGSASNTFRIYHAASGTLGGNSLVDELSLPRNNIPLSANFTDDSDYCLVQADLDVFYALKLAEGRWSLIPFAKNLHEVLLSITCIKLQLPAADSAADKRALSIVIDKRLGVVFVGSNEGYVSLFDSLESVVGNYEKTFYGHSSGLADIEFDFKRKVLYTIGRNDSAVFEWKVEYADCGTEGRPLAAKGTRQLPSALAPRPIAEDQTLQLDNEAHIDLYYAHIAREIKANQSFKVRTEYLEETFGYFQGYTSDDLQKMLDIQTEKFDHASKLSFRYPPCSIKLNHVYSLQNMEVRNNFCYFHCPAGESADESDRNLSLHEERLLPKFISSLEPDHALTSKRSIFFQRGLSFRSSQLNLNVMASFLGDNASLQRLSAVHQFNKGPNKVLFESKSNFFSGQGAKAGPSNAHFEDADSADSDPSIELLDCDSEILKRCYHSYGRCNDHGPHKCSRKIVYFISRIAIVVSPDCKEHQAFYEGHKAKISVIVVHHQGTLVATGERTFLPKIHVWSPQKLQNVSICDTFHREGIAVLKFSFLGFYLLSISVDAGTSIQLSDWRTGNVLVFRNTSAKKIISAQFDPLDDTSFATAALSQVDLWRIQGHAILHMQSVALPLASHRCYVTDLHFLNYYDHERISKSLLVATSDGQLGLVQRGCLYKMLPRSLEHAVNIIKIVIYANAFLVFLTTYDCALRVYNLQFQEIFSLSLLEILENKISPQIESLDVYLRARTVFCLVGLTNGSLKEVQLSVDSGDGHGKDFAIAWQRTSDLYSGHAPAVIDSAAEPHHILVNKQILFCVDKRNAEKSNIIITAGPNSMLLAWNTDTKKTLLALKMECDVTCIKFTPSYSLLVIGLANGKVKLYQYLKDRDSSASLDLREDSAFYLEHSPPPDASLPFAVLNIEFSNDGSKLAVSYTPLAQRAGGKATAPCRESSPVHVYISRSLSGTDSPQAQSAPYTFFCERRPAAKLGSEGARELQKYARSAYFMAFTSNNDVLVAYYQKVRSQLLSRKISDLNGSYVLYDVRNVKEQQVLPNNRMLKYDSLHFPMHIHGRRILGAIKSSPDYTADHMQMQAFKNLNNDNIIISCGSLQRQVLALGSHSGEIYLSKKAMLAHDKSESSGKSLQLDSYQAKRYQGHTSFINQIEFYNHWLFTAGISDECIFQWKVAHMDERTELDHMDGIEMQDPYYMNEVEDFQQFSGFITRVVPSRKRISEILLQKDKTAKAALKLSLQGIFGRKAYTRRSNILLLPDGRLVYSSGTALVLLDMHDVSDLRTREEESEPESAKARHNHVTAHSKVLGSNVRTFNDLELVKRVGRANAVSKRPGWPSRGDLSSSSLINEMLEGPLEYHVTGLSNKQRVLFPNANNQIKAAAEIMCFELAPNMATLCIAIKEEYSSILVWDVNCDCFKGSFILEQCISPILLRCSHDSQFIVCCGITKDYSISLYFCSLRKLEVLAMLNLKYSNPKKIVDLAFLPHKNDEFMTVGFIHCAKWNYKAGVLEFREVKLEFPEKRNVPTDYQHDSKSEESHCLFLVVKFLTASRFILTDSIGYIYLCGEEKVHQRIRCFTDVPVTTLAFLRKPEEEDSFLIAATGFDNYIHFFTVCSKLENSQHLNPLGKIAIETPVLKELLNFGDMKDRSEFQVQSFLFISPRKLLYGTRDGSIIILSLQNDIAANVKECKGCEAALRHVEQSSTAASSTKIVQLTAHELVRFADHQAIKIADLSWNSQLLFLLTGEGKLIIYNVSRFVSVAYFEFGAPPVNMYITDSYAFFVFKDQIKYLFIDPTIDFDALHDDQLASPDAGSENPGGTFCFDRFQTLEFEWSIDKSCISRSRRYLALVASGRFEEAKEASACILLYKVNSAYHVTKTSAGGREAKEVEKNKLQPTLEFLNKVPVATCALVDFSVNENYFVYANDEGRSFVYYFTESACSFMGENFKTRIDWQGPAIRLMDSSDTLNSHFNDDNKLAAVVRLSQNAILASDEVGTVNLSGPRIRVPGVPAILSGLPRAHERRQGDQTVDRRAVCRHGRRAGEVELEETLCCGSWRAVRVTTQLIANLCPIDQMSFVPRNHLARL